MDKPNFEENLLAEFRAEDAREQALKVELAASRMRKRKLKAIMPARLLLELQGAKGAAALERGFVEQVLAENPEGLTVLELTEVAAEAAYEPISQSPHPGRAASAALWALVKTGRVYRSGGARFRLRKEHR